MRHLWIWFLFTMSSSSLMAEAIRLGKCYEIPGQTGISYAPKVAMNASHAAIIMWENASPEGNHICVDLNCNRSSWGWIPFVKLDRVSSLRLLECSVDDSNRSHHLLVTETKPGKYQLHLSEWNLNSSRLPEAEFPAASHPFDPSHNRVAFRKNGELFLVRFLREGKKSPKFTLQEFSPATGGYIEIAPASKNHYFHHKIFLDQCAIAASSSGNDCVVWEEQDYPRTQILFSEKLNQVQWSHPLCLYQSPKGGYLSDLKIATGKHSQVAVVGVAFSEGKEARRVFGLTRNLNGDWSAVQELSAFNQEVLNLKVMFDEEGNALAIWEAIIDGRHEIWSVYKPLHQDWQAPACLSQPSFHHQAPQIQVSGSRCFVVVWQDNVDGKWSIHSRIFNGSKWTEDRLLQLGSQSRQPSFAIAGNQGVIAWLKASQEGTWKVNYAHFSIF